ncbi:MAG TPA: hypothetical protein VMT16_05875, partial [Thermoanaerobaculia bacterium]|nr:hypothetical protein [Thermoanaerobaculia bacterium]
MKRTVLCLALAMLLALGGQAIAQAGLCTIDQVPAATMLLPYFEVDLACDGTGITTLFSVNNASAAAAVAHVVFWTDLSVPTLDFDIYLTGFDVQTVNLRDVFCDGKIPVTADQSQDTGTDSISPQGIWSEDISFPGAFGPCGNVYPSPALNQTYLTNHLRSIHTGGRSSLYAACGGEVFGDNLARGYITIDNALRCSLLFPSDEGYFAGEEGVASNVNQLWG